MSFLKKKIDGLKLIFSEKTTRYLSMTVFILLILLVSAKYFPDTTYALTVGMISTIIFCYVFTYGILVGIQRSLPNLRKKEKKSSPKSIRIVQAIAAIFVAFSLLIPGLNIVYILFILGIINITCYAWAIIENYYLARSIYGIAGKVSKEQPKAKFILHFVIAGVYAGYLIYKIVKAFLPSSTGSSIQVTASIDQNVLDWLISLVMFVLAFAEMGARYLIPVALVAEQAEKTHAEEKKIRFLIVTVLFLTLGFHLFVDGLPAMVISIFSAGSQATWIFQSQERIYTIMRLVFFAPIMILIPLKMKKENAAVLKESK